MGTRTATVTQRRARPRARASTIAFEGLESGTEFDVVAGSMVGPLGVTGTSKLVEFGADRTEFRTRVGPLGMIRATTVIERIEGTLVRITSSGRGAPSVAVDARIVVDEPDHICFQHVDQPDDHQTSFRRGADGTLTLRTVAPAVGGVVMRLRATR